MNVCFEPKACFEIISTEIKVIFNYLRFFFICLFLRRLPCILQGFMICQLCNIQIQLCNAYYTALKTGFQHADFSVPV